MDKKQRNEGNIGQVVDVLIAANYQHGRTIQNKNGSVEFWVGPGRIPVIAMQVYPNNDGFELWIPITQSNRMDDTLYQLRDATNVVRKVSA